MKNVFKFLKIAIATAILGVAVFNATLALNIGKSSDFTLAKIEAVAQGEGGNGCEGCTGCTQASAFGGGYLNDGNSFITWDWQTWECFQNTGSLNPCTEGFYYHYQDGIEFEDYWDVYCE